MRFRVAHSGNAFSPWEMSKQIASSLTDFAFDALLMLVIKAEKSNDGEGTEGDPSEGTGFEPVRDMAPTPNMAPAIRPSAPHPSTALPTTSHTNATRGSVDPDAASSGSESDTAALPTHKGKRKSKAAVAYKKLAFKRRRAVARQHAKGNPDIDVQPSMRKRHTASATPIRVPSFSMGMKIPAKTGYVGIRDPKASKKVYRQNEMAGEGSRFSFNLVEWDGKVSCPITDKKGRVIATLCGHPDDPSWEAAHKEAAAIMKRAQRRIRRTKKNSKHRRGHFIALAAGVSFGGGQKVPGNLVNTPANTEILNEILESTAFIRIARFTNSCFATWAPKLFTYYLVHTTSLFDHYGTQLRQNFATVFACSTFNFGPSTVSFPHTDPGNLPYGWCAVTSLGSFDPKRGGHLVLWDLQLVIEFPPGSTILLPSAVIRHSNTAIQNGEERYSFTQYTAGGLFRWVDHGFQKEKEYHASLSEGQRLAEEEAMRRRWAMGLSLFSTLDELKSTPQ